MNQQQANALWAHARRLEAAAKAEKDLTKAGELTLEAVEWFGKWQAVARGEKTDA